MLTPWILGRGRRGWSLMAASCLLATPALGAECDLLAPVLPCEIGGQSYDAFAGNFSSNRSFYRTGAYDYQVTSEAVVLTIRPGESHGNGTAYVRGYGTPVWTSPAPYSRDFGLFGSFGSSTVATDESFVWLGSNAPGQFSLSRPQTLLYYPPDSPYSRSSQVSFDGAVFRVHTRIALTGTDPQDFRDTWERGIESIWNRFGMTDGHNDYKIRFSVDFVDSSQAHDYAIEVSDDLLCEWSTRQWCTGFGRYPLQASRANGDFWLLHQRAASHEFGHLLSLFDEYRGGLNDPLVDPADLCRLGPDGQQAGSLCDGLMGDFVRGDVVPRYYDRLADFLRTASGLPDLVLGQLPGYQPSPQLVEPGTGLVVLDIHAAAVPDAPSALLMALGLLVVRGCRRVRRCRG